MDSTDKRAEVTATMVTRGILSLKDLRAAIKTDLGVVDFRSLSDDHDPGEVVTLPRLVKAYGPVNLHVALPNGQDAVVTATKYPSGRIGAAVKREVNQ